MRSRFLILSVFWVFLWCSESVGQSRFQSCEVDDETIMTIMGDLEPGAIVFVEAQLDYSMFGVPREECPDVCQAHLWAGSESYLIDILSWLRGMPQYGVTSSTDSHESIYSTGGAPYDRCMTQWVFVTTTAAWRHMTSVDLNQHDPLPPLSGVSQPAGVDSIAHYLGAMVVQGGSEFLVPAGEHH
jgi:hypothetical protein